MNDHHLDPPEYPEVPECCDLEMSDACDHLGDLAFDASREQRLFRNR